MHKFCFKFDCIFILYLFYFLMKLCIFFIKTYAKIWGKKQIHDVDKHINYIIGLYNKKHTGTRFIYGFFKSIFLRCLLINMYIINKYIYMHSYLYVNIYFLARNLFVIRAYNHRFAYRCCIFSYGYM